MRINIANFLHLMCLAGIQGYLVLIYGTSEFLDTYYYLSSGYIFCTAISGTIIPLIWTPGFVKIQLRVEQNTLTQHDVSVIFYSTIAIFITIAFFFWFYWMLISSISTAIDTTNAIIQTATLFSFILNALLTCFYNSRERYVYPILSLLSGSVAQLILIIYWSDLENITTLFISLLLSQFLTNLILLSGIKSANVKNLESVDVIFPYLNKAKFTIVSVLFGKSDIPIDRTLLASTDPGILSSFTLAQFVISSILSVTTKSVSLISLTKYSDVNDHGDTRADLMRRSQRYLLNTYHLSLIIITSGYCFDEFIEFEAIRGEVGLFSALLVGVLIGGTLSTYTSNFLFATEQIKRHALISMGVHLGFNVLKIVLFLTYGFFVIPILLSMKAFTSFAIMYLQIPRGLELMKLRISLIVRIIVMYLSTWFLIFNNAIFEYVIVLLWLDLMLKAVWKQYEQ